MGSEQGKILLFRQGQYSMTILNPPGDHGMPVTSLTAVPGGFVAGSAERIYFYVYDDMRADQLLYDDQVKLITYLETDLFHGMVLNMAPSPTDEMMVAMTSDAQLVEFPITSPQSLVRTSNTAYALSMVNLL